MKSYTDVAQSKKLAEILPIESADHHYVRQTCDFMGNPVDGEWSTPKYGSTNSKYANYLVQNFTTYETIPCWSLAALLDFLAQQDYFPEITDIGTYYLMDVNFYDNEDSKHLIRTERNTLVDACYEMIIKLHEQKLI